MFEFNIMKLAESLQYLNGCCEWLTVEDNLSCLSHELRCEMIQEIIEQAKGSLRSAYAVRYRMHSPSSIPPPSLDAVFRDAEDSRPLRFRVSLDLEKIQGTTTQATSALRNIFSLYNKLLPVNRLPPELLGTIFEHTIEAMRPGELGENPLRYAWPTIQAVCRRWRSIAVRTPVLWSYIRISRSLQYYSSRLVDGENMVSICLERSGSLPLAIAICNTIGHAQYDTVFNKALMQDLATIVPRIRELRMHHYLHSNFLELFASKTSRVGLETLILERPSSIVERSVDLFDDWNTPNLRTLCIDEFTGWPKASFSTLRHLILTNQRFTATALRALHSILTLNHYLEDLILEDIGSGDDPFVDELPAVDMPCLRRIAVTSHEGSIWSSVGQLVEKSLCVQAGHAKFHSRLSSEALRRIFPAGSHSLWPISRLFIGRDGRVIGTDGHTSFCFHTNSIPYKFLQLYSNHTGCGQVPELWLWSELELGIPNNYEESRAPRQWCMSLETLAGVQKLVLLYDIHAWLDFISQYGFLLSVTELQLHIRYLHDVSHVLAFVETRRDSGYPIDTLRFILDSPCISALQTFSFLEENTLLFEQAVPHVVFEDPTMAPPRMALPDICLTESSTHSYWKAWSLE